MATGKKYFWIKIKDSFMTSDKVDYLMSQKDGANYIVLYQMLCLKTINTNGEFRREIGEVITANARVFKNVPHSIQYKGA